jgi:hypothetical protein
VLDDAADAGLPAAVLDDDPLWPPRFVPTPGRTLPLDPEDALDAVLDVMGRTGASLGGVNDVGNAAWVEPVVSQRNIGCVLVVAAGSPLRMDEDLPNYGEDFDYNAQHLVNGTGLARLDYIVWRFSIGEQEGSLSSDGVDERAARALAILAERWPGIIVPGSTTGPTGPTLMPRYRPPRVTNPASRP